LLKILKDLKKNAIDILIGTQMVAKGHDFPNITLVGVICADLSLNFPDFRSGARTFQLLAQVAGRAGRGEAPGRVILQTFNPDHFSIAAAKTQDFRVFYNQDIVFRKALLYPPFSRLIMFKISGKDKNVTGAHACLLGKIISTTLMKSSFSQSISVLGPIASAIPKIANQYRWQLILKGRHVKSLHQFMKHFIISQKKLFHHPTVKVSIDVDPIFMM
jgi:primosomal protein N' (replication factor Y)